MHPFAASMVATPEGPPTARQREMASRILEAFEAAGLTTAAGIAAVVNAYAESHLDPNAWGDRTHDPEGIGCSGGLFQLNRCGGLGTGMSRSAVTDPATNINTVVKVARRSRVFGSAPEHDPYALARAFTTDVMRPSNAQKKALYRAGLIDVMWPGVMVPERSAYGAFLAPLPGDDPGVEATSTTPVLTGPEPWTSPRWATGRVDRDWDQAQKWASLEPGFAQRLRRVFRTLQAAGHRPTLWFGWRRPGMQAGLVKAGRSQAPFSLHEALGDHGEPAALAADVIDPRFGWGVQVQNGVEVQNPATFPGAKRFFQALGQAAAAEGLPWGGNYSRRAGTLWGDAGLGWDPGHVQGVSGDELPAIAASTRQIWEEAARRAAATVAMR